MLFELIAPVYDRLAKLAKFDQSHKIAEWLSPVEGKEVLDLGGGTGINVPALVEAEAILTVADSSPAMLERARVKKLPAKLILTDAVNLPLPEQSFDIILISDAWHHFRDQAAVIHEITRVLRPGGRLYIIDFDPRKRKTRFLSFLEKTVAEPSTFTPPDELVKMLDAVGIEGNYRFLSSNQYLYKGLLAG